MKKILKIILLSIVGLLIVGGVAFMAFKSLYVPSHLKNTTDLEDIIYTMPDDEVKNVSEEFDENLPVKTSDELWIEHIEGSDRVNVLLMGTDGYRADTLMVMSYSKEEDDVTFITVPRDTYNKVEGKNYLGQDKINAVYCFGNDMGGPDNQRIAVEKILGIPLHYYVKVNYNGLKAIVNHLGGVTVNVHRDMNYDDPYANPPLHIHLNAGTQLIKGDDAMGYVRWRKNNDGSGDSDLERTKRQQDFMIALVKKSFGFDILNVIGITFDYVRTDMTKEDVLYFGTDMINFDFSTINTYMIPGEADYSYYYHDPIGTKELVQKIYGFE